MTDLHTHRATAADRGRASERVRTASRVVGAGAVVAAVGLTAALVPHGAAAASSTVTPDDGTPQSGDSSVTSTAPSSGRDGGGSVTHSGGS